jgi:hypothetical protein
MVGGGLGVAAGAGVSANSAAAGHPEAASPSAKKQITTKTRASAFFPISLGLARAQRQGIRT